MPIFERPARPQPVVVDRENQKVLTQLRMAYAAVFAAYASLTDLIFDSENPQALLDKLGNTGNGSDARKAIDFYNGLEQLLEQAKTGSTTAKAAKKRAIVVKAGKLELKAKGAP